MKTIHTIDLDIVGGDIVATVFWLKDAENSDKAVVKLTLGTVLSGIDHVKDYLRLYDYEIDEDTEVLVND